MLRIAQFLVSFRNRAGWLARRDLGVILETSWLAHRRWFLTTQSVLYVIYIFLHGSYDKDQITGGRGLFDGWRQQ